ncbi:MAG: beta-ketoacyl synthase [Bacteroidales bacterium]|nr:beta-ketoacyl synthase [Bacteroidales bacterium]
MIYNIGDNIVSPLGFTTEENWNSVLHGRSGLARYEGKFGLPEPFFAAILDEDAVNERFGKIYSGKERYTKFEKMAMLSVSDAVQRAGISCADREVVFVLSTTKGNVELLEDACGYEEDRKYLWKSAQLIAQFFGNPNEPVVVSNACISGCAAQITAARLLQRGYRYAVVVGADVLSRFIISGFQSFKALSPEQCRPFDSARCGLNLGEAAATIVYSVSPKGSPTGGEKALVCGAICNDANHISAPSRTAEGLVAALRKVLLPQRIPDVALVSAHGTATLYNDDMESVAIHRMQLAEVPVNSLKGYFGHTLGAAGILETILGFCEVGEGVLLPTAGAQNPGTLMPLNVVLTRKKTGKVSFLKIISGFGGSNAAILCQWQKGGGQ